MAEGIYFFGADLFGNQYVLKGNLIGLFDAETGKIEEMARSVEEWARRLLDDAYWSGWSLGHQWQMRHGPLQGGHRLFPNIPFVLGGEFSIENLHVSKSASGMRSRASLALQIRDVADGQTVKLSVAD